MLRPNNFYVLKIQKEYAVVANNNDFSKARHYYLYNYENVNYFISSSSFYYSKENVKTHEWVKKKMRHKTNIPIVHELEVIFLKIDTLIFFEDITDDFGLTDKIIKKCKCFNDCLITCIVKNESFDKLEDVSIWDNDHKINKKNTTIFFKRIP